MNYKNEDCRQLDTMLMMNTLFILLLSCNTQIPKSINTSQPPLPTPSSNEKPVVYPAPSSLFFNQI